MTKKLLNHIEAMQGAMTSYIAPGPYQEFSGSASAAEGDQEAQDALFIGDMIYMLDGPEQREAQAEAEAVANFIPDAMRTCSPGFHGDKVEIGQLIAAMREFVSAANRLDRIKKALFYGRDYIENPSRPSVTSAAPLDNSSRFVSALMRDHEVPAYQTVFEQLVHGIVGVATESGEMIEALIDAYLLGKPVDFVNLREEGGDNLWYLAIYFDALSNLTGEPCDFETEERRVIAKLRERFPTKFTEHAANNRDLDAERAVLEGVEKTSD